MTCDELIQEICEHLNLTSDEAKSRVARRLNARYREITSSIGLDLTRRAVVSKAATIGNSTIQFTGVEKLLSVYTVSGTTNTILEEVTADTMKEEDKVSGTPTKYAIIRIYPTSIDVSVNCVPAGSGFTLYADAMVTLTTLAGSAAPQFPESYHDVLIKAVIADEYRKMEKQSLAKDADDAYQRRLSDLRMWVAKSAWKDVYQGKNSQMKWWEQQQWRT